MKFINIFLILISMFICYNFALAEDDHDSHAEKLAHSDDHGHKHTKSERHKKAKKIKKIKNAPVEEHDEHEEKSDHDHKAHGKEEDHHDHDNHGNEEEHDEHGDHGEGGHDDHGEEAFGDGKAITAVFNEGQKFKLSSDSAKLLNVTAKPIKELKTGIFEIPKESLVRYQGNIGVFILDDGWYELIELKTAKKSDDGWLIQSAKLKNNHSIVVSGVSLLRVAHLQASGQGGKGHAH